MNLFYLIILLALATFLTRYSLFAFAAKIKFSNNTKQLLKFFPPAIFAALVAPVVFTDTSISDNGLFITPELIGGLVAFTCAWLRANLITTLVLGMSAYLGFSLI
jgi:branched-subunit amino acid transport protein